MPHEKPAHEALRGYVRYDNERYIAVAALEKAGLLLPEPAPVTTIEELHSLDPDSMLTSCDGNALTASSLQELNAAEQQKVIDAGIAVTVEGKQVREVRRQMDHADNAARDRSENPE